MTTKESKNILRKLRDFHNCAIATITDLEIRHRLEKERRIRIEKQLEELESEADTMARAIVLFFDTNAPESALTVVDRAFEIARQREDAKV